VLFPQERVGLDGRVLLALKFRSRRPDAETLTGPVQATENDPRVTGVGRVLRATAMDELPQLVNILRGDMSFVGPRPLRPGEVDVRGDGQLVALEQIPGYRERHAVRPGLTSRLRSMRRATSRERASSDSIVCISAPDSVSTCG
jgi:lipopolysaccharide/colanic/teichoic acid biosynthesis glycosyltransferase